MKKLFADAIKQHRPVGYKLRHTRMKSLDGLVTFERSITINAELDRQSPDWLFVFLHECGHVHSKHCVQDGKLVGDRAQEEYEADQYAIKAMRDYGVAIPRDRMAHQKKQVRDLIEAAPDDNRDEAVLRYAYGRNWRKHR